MWLGQATNALPTITLTTDVPISGRMYKTGKDVMLVQLDITIN